MRLSGFDCQCWVRTSNLLKPTWERYHGWRLSRIQSELMSVSFALYDDHTGNFVVVESCQMKLGVSGLAQASRILPESSGNGLTILNLHSML